MSQDKATLIGAMLAKLESGYGTFASPVAATDQIWLAEPAEISRKWVYDGARDPQFGGIGPYQRVAPSGPYWEGVAKVRPRGNNTAYSISVFPLDVHQWLRASGHDSAFAATKHTYTPDAGPTAFDSLSIEAYSRGQKHQLKGAYCDFNITCENPGIPLFEFPFMAMQQATPADAAPPAITYNTTAIPQKATGMVFSIGSYLVGKVRSFSFNKNHKRVVRTSNVDAGTVVGFAYDDFDPRLKVQLEATLLATTPFHLTTGLDPYKLMELATALGVTITVGSAAQDKWTLTAGQAQMVDANDTKDGPIALWDLEFQCNPTTPTSVDHYSLVFGV